MSASLNKVILIGNLGKDPETRYLSNGEAVTNITVAASESWKDKNGEKQERTEWINVVFYRKLAEVAGQYLHKGSQVYIVGKLQTRKYTDKNGVDRYSTEVIADQMKMLGSKSNSSGDRQPSNQAPSKTANGFEDMSDDIPF